MVARKADRHRRKIQPFRRLIITRPLLFSREEMGRKLTLLQHRLLKVKIRLNEHDERHETVNHALKHATPEHLLTLMEGGTVSQNSKMRILVDYSPIHTLLQVLSRGKLAESNILHLAASTGVYVKFLQDEEHAHAVALDIDRHSLKFSKERGVKRNVAAEGVHHKIKTGYAAQPGGSIVVPEYKQVHLPFREKSFDFIVSDHFLFSNYHTEYTEEAGGFEYHKGSIEKSEDTLKELNRVLRKNGRVIIGRTHLEETPDLIKYQRRFLIHGFIVEAAYDEVLKPAKGNYPRIFVLRKVRDI